MAGLVGNGKRFNVTLSGSVTKDTVYAGDTLAGVYMKSGGNGDVVPVALEGAFKFTTGSAGATVKFAVLDKVYATSSGGVLTNSASSAVALGYALNATTSGGGESVVVKLAP